MEKGQTVAEYGLFGMLLVAFVIMVLAFIPMPTRSNELLNDISFYAEAIHTNATRFEEAEAVRKCMYYNGYMQLWFKEDDDGAKYIQVCQLPNGKFGIQIMAANLQKEITAFIKNKMKRLSQVEKYLQNGGAIRLK